MKFCWFATFRDAKDPHCQITGPELDWLHEVIAQTPGLACGLIHTPWAVEGLPFDDGQSPKLQLQLYFEEIGALETAIGKSGHLQQLSDPLSLSSLTNQIVTEQAMLVRTFPVVETPAPNKPFCTFLVHYPGPAENLNLWLRHYLDEHVPVMQRFPGIRGVEVTSRIDWCSALPWERVHYMQRNKVVFDDAQALKFALSSSVMDEMRADSASFPPFSGGNAHFPMRTVQVRVNTV